MHRRCCASVMCFWYSGSLCIWIFVNCPADFKRNSIQCTCCDRHISRHIAPTGCWHVVNAGTSHGCGRSEPYILCYALRIAGCMCILQVHVCAVSVMTSLADFGSAVHASRCLNDSHYLQLLIPMSICGCCCSLRTWLILPVVICLYQRLSHACVCIDFYIVKLRIAH